MAITTVVFDIGNVLADFCWERHMEKFHFSKEIFDRVAKATVHSPAWGEFDRGTPEQEVLAMFIQNDPGVEKEIRQMFENISDTIHMYPMTIPWIMDLKKKGYKVLVLSNLSNKTLCECAPDMEFLNYIDGGILSFRDKVVKPEPKIYELLIERYFLKPEECVFVDDRAENIETAKKLGMNGIVFTTHEAAVEELKQLGVG